MDVRDIRIGDIVGVKSLDNGKMFCFVKAIDSDGYVHLETEDEDTMDCHISTILGQKAKQNHTIFQILEHGMTKRKSNISSRLGVV